MKVILDTNVLLSALLSPHGAPNTIYKCWQERSLFELVTSPVQIMELRHASRYQRFREQLQPYRVGTMINSLRCSMLLDIRPPFPDSAVTDSNDAFLLAMAMAGEADYLVTGDHRSGLLQLGNIGRTRIVNPTDFCTIVL